MSCYAVVLCCCRYGNETALANDPHLNPVTHLTMVSKAIHTCSCLLGHTPAASRSAKGLPRLWWLKCLGPCDTFPKLALLCLAVQPDRPDDYLGPNIPGPDGAELPGCVQVYEQPCNRCMPA